MKVTLNSPYIFNVDNECIHRIYDGKQLAKACQFETIMIYAYPIVGCI